MKFIYAVINIVILSVLTSSCGVVPGYSLKKSSSNKIFDTKGFEGSKRRPLYNKKYIDKAKQNITSNFTDDDYDLEEEEKFNPSAYNKKMYMQMLSDDKDERVRLKARKKAYLLKKTNELETGEDDMDLYATKVRIDNDIDNKPRDQLEKELKNIKSLLEETKEEISKAKCPYAPENVTTQKLKNSSKSNEQLKPRPKNKDQAASHQPKTQQVNDQGLDSSNSVPSKASEALGDPASHKENVDVNVSSKA